MGHIHATALVDPGATLGADVVIGPFCVVGPDVELGDGTHLHSHVVVTGRTVLGARCEVFPFAAIGHVPQDRKYQGEENRIVIGDETVIREHVTVHPGTVHGDLTTRVGSHCYILASAHIAHDCQLGDHVTLINNATLGGHVTIGHHAMLGGLSAVHQFVRIGPYAFVGGMTGVADDVIPYGLVLGNRGALCGLNIVGLRRAGFSREEIHELRKAYRMLFSAEGTLLERVEDVEKMFSDNETVQTMLEFIRTPVERPLCLPRNGTAAI